MFGLKAGYCASPAYEGFTAQEQALVHSGYVNVRSIWVPRNCPTGIGGATCQSNGTGCSLHNYGIASDIDPFGYGNPHFQAAYGKGWDFSDCKITEKQVLAVEAIKNTNGDKLFRWLGWAIGDTMHFEYQVPPTRTKVDWTTVLGGQPGGTDDVITRATKGIEAEDFQRALNSLGLKDASGAVLKVDGVLGDKTFQAYNKGLAELSGVGWPVSNEVATNSALAAIAAKRTATGVVPHGHSYAPAGHGHTATTEVK